MSGARVQVVGNNEDGMRLDRWFGVHFPQVTFGHLQKLIRTGQVRIDSGRAKTNSRLEAGQQVRVPPLDAEVKRIEQKINAEDAAFLRDLIVYEDDELYVFNKPPGLASQGGSGTKRHMDGLLKSLPNKQGEAPRLVHRLDRDTSGILMLAKKRSALTNLHEQIREGNLDKRYFTLVKGDWTNPRQHIRLALHKYSTPDGERRVRVQSDGMVSHTIFNLVKKYGPYALLEAELKTGRTHQIRVHLASSGFPIVGDDKYGDFALNRELQRADGLRAAFKRMFLHAHQLTFVHPDSGKPITLKAALPPECQRLLKALEQQAAG